MAYTFAESSNLRKCYVLRDGLFSKHNLYVVHTPTNVLFINSVKSFEFTLKHDHHRGALSLSN